MDSDELDSELDELDDASDELDSSTELLDSVELELERELELSISPIFPAQDGSLLQDSIAELIRPA